MAQNFNPNQGQQQSYDCQNYGQGQMPGYYNNQQWTAASNQMQMRSPPNRSLAANQQTFEMDQAQMHYFPSSQFGQFNPYENYLPTQQSPQFYGQQLPQQVYQQYNQQSFQQQHSQPQFMAQAGREQHYQQSPRTQASNQQRQDNVVQRGSIDLVQSPTYSMRQSIPSASNNIHHSPQLVTQPDQQNVVTKPSNDHQFRQQQSRPQQSINQLSQQNIPQHLNQAPQFQQAVSQPRHQNFTPTLQNTSQPQQVVNQQPVQPDILNIEGNNRQFEQSANLRVQRNMPTSSTDAPQIPPVINHAVGQNHLQKPKNITEPQQRAKQPVRQTTAPATKPTPYPQQKFSQPTQKNSTPNVTHEPHFQPSTHQSLQQKMVANPLDLPRFQQEVNQSAASSEPAHARILQNSTQNKPLPPPQPTIKQLQSQSQLMQLSKQADLTTQYPSLLLTLADEYVEAASKLTTRSKQYYELVATAISCMDLTLRNFRLEPLREAQLRLKHAQILYDETSNIEEAELVLTKGIDLCDNMKFIDLKYAMKSLQVKLLARSNTRAAMRDLKKLITDVETYRHTAWEYAFRFQAVCLAVNPDGPLSLHEAFQQLSKIQHTARLHTDHGIYAFASIIEAQLHLQSPAADNIQLSQRALAQARSLQLNPDVDKHPQMQVLMDMIDLIWSIIECNEKEISRKRQLLKEGIYEKGVDHPNWSHGEAIWLRVNTKSLKGIQVQDGGLIHQVDGKFYIALSWVGKKELETLGFLLIGVALAPQNCQQKGKAVNFLQGGLPLLEEELLGSDNLILGREDALVQRCHILAMHLKAETAFLLSAQGKWQAVKDIIVSIEKHLKQLTSDAPSEFIVMLKYLKGCHAQGTGDLTQAINCFTSKTLVLERRDEESGKIFKMSATEQTINSFKVLAAMNTILIIRNPNHPLHKQTQIIVTTVASRITTTSPQLLSAAHSIVLSALPNLSTLQLKAVLGDALKFARSINNNQIISLTLTLMQDKFFRGGVQNAQAISCAKAAAHQVRSKWGQPLWIVMSEMMQVESLRLQADPQDPKEYDEKRKDIAQKQLDMQRTWITVPETVRNSMRG